jgi:hypothetical protein
MKKQFIKMVVLLALPLIVLQSCSKEDEESKNTSTVNMGSATITGRLTADLILNNGEIEGLSGVTITASIPSNDLVTNNTAPISGNRVFTAVTDANGFYTLNIDVNNKPVNVTLNIPGSVLANQTKENGSIVRVNFTTNAVSGPITLNRGQVHVHDAKYSFSQTASIGKATIKGKVEFRNDLCKGISSDLDSQLNTVPANTFLIFNWGSGANAREIVIPVGTDGKYEFVTDITDATTFSIRGRKFRAERKSLNFDNDCVGKDHDYNLSVQFVNVNRDEVEFRDFVFQ